MNLGKSFRHYQPTLLIGRANIKGIVALMRPIINSKTQLSLAVQSDPERSEILPDRSASAVAHLQFNQP